MSHVYCPTVAYASDFNRSSGTGIAKYQVGLLTEVAHRAIANGGSSHRTILFRALNRGLCPQALPDGLEFRRCALPGKVQRLLNRILGVPIEKLVDGLRHAEIVHSLVPETISTKLPWVVTIYDTAWRKFGPSYDSVFPRSCQADAERAIRKANHLIAISGATADDLLAGGVHANKISVIRPGIESRFGAVTRDQICEVRKRYDLPERFIAYAGTFHARKNIRTLLRAVRDIRPECAPPLVIAGPTPPEGLGHWGVDGKAIRHIGYLDDSEMPGYYAAADVFVFPSLHEGFGLPLVESMASGTAVVASEIPIFREVGGDHFLSFDSAATNAAEQLRERVDALWFDERMRADLAVAGRRHAEQYTWSACRTALHETYRRLTRANC